MSSDSINELEEFEIDFDTLIKQSVEKARANSKEYVDAKINGVINKLKKNNILPENLPVISSVNEDIPSAHYIVDPTIQHEIIDEVVKVLTKEERLAAKLHVYEELLKKEALEYDHVLQKKLLLNQQKLDAQRHELAIREREVLIQSKCPACNSIPDSFGRCRCSSVKMLNIIGPMKALYLFIGPKNSSNTLI